MALDVLTPAIACLQVVLHSLTSFAAKLLSRRNQAVAGVICAFVRFFSNQDFHIPPPQPLLSISIAPPNSEPFTANRIFIALPPD
jgi:hypothetical protein